jgi:hypothetical protein
MREPNVLLVSSNRNLIRCARRSLASTGYRVDYCPMHRDEVVQRLLGLRGICLIDADERGDEIRWLLQQLRQEHPDVSPLLLSHNQDAALIMDLLREEQLNNLIARHGGLFSTSDLVDEGELIVTCSKLIRRDIFGLDKYLATWAVRVHEREIRSTDDKQQAMIELESFLDQIDCYRGIKSSVLVAADELLMNAIFDAPRTPDGAIKYVDHHARVDLLPEETVQLRYACDGRNILLSVSDHCGSMDRKVIIEYLRHCFCDKPTAIEYKDGGAGLGLHMVFNSITQLTFNVHVGRTTEVIASFYVRSGSRAFKMSGRSLNFFFAKDLPAS